MAMMMFSFGYISTTSEKYSTSTGGYKMLIGAISP